MAAETKSDSKSALVTGRGASNNPHLTKVVDSIKAGYKPHRIGKSNRQLRVENTAMIPNPTDVWAWKKTADGENSHPVLFFRAGWYLSAAENHIVEELMKDPENVKLNKTIEKQKIAAGVPVEVESAEAEGAKVVA